MKNYFESDLGKAVSFLIKAVELAIDKGVYNMEDILLIVSAIEVIAPGYIDSRLENYVKENKIAEGSGSSSDMRS